MKYSDLRKMDTMEALALLARKLEENSECITPIAAMTDDQEMDKALERLTLVNLAEAFAKKKYRVVLLDGDLRNPSVMKCMGLIGRKERGIAAVLKGQMDWEEALTDCRDLTLKILPGAGSTQNPAGLLRSVRMKTMIESLKEEADLLIIDTPPCGVLS